VKVDLTKEEIKALLRAVAYAGKKAGGRILDPDGDVAAKNCGMLSGRMT
jgi:hypothetical protein